MAANRPRRARAAKRRKRRMERVENDLSVEQWEALKAAWGGCAYCGESASPMQRDCVLALSRGGRYTLANVVPACGSCNSSKCNDEVTGWLRRKRLDERAFLLRHLELSADLAQRFQPLPVDQIASEPDIGDETGRVEAVIRRIRPEEGPVLQEIRLAALADSPSAFGSSYAAEDGQTDEHWGARAVVGAAGESSVTLLAVVAGSVVGMVAGYRPDAAGRSVELVSMWVSPAHRGAGIAAGLVDAVVGWARETGAATVDLWVTRGNDAAVRLYEAAGFRLTGDHQPLPSDPCKDELRMRRIVDDN